MIWVQVNCPGIRLLDPLHAQRNYTLLLRFCFGAFILFSLTHESLQLKLLCVPDLLVIRGSLLGQSRASIYSTCAAVHPPGHPRGAHGRLLPHVFALAPFISSTRCPVGLVLGPRVRREDIQQNVDKEVEQEGNGVEDEDVADMSDVGVAQEPHLLFCGAHEEEPGGIEKLLFWHACMSASDRRNRGGTVETHERGQMLPAVGFASSLAIPEQE